MFGESEKKKFICLYCGTVFEREKEAPQCPNCHRRKVMSFDLFVQSIEKHKDKLRELGILSEPTSSESASNAEEMVVEARETVVIKIIVR